MKKNVIYVDFRFTHKRILSKKLHLLYKINYFSKKFFNLFKKNTNQTRHYYQQPSPFKRIL